VTTPTRRSSCAQHLLCGEVPRFSDFSYERFAQDEIARLEELHVAAVEDRIEADLALGDTPTGAGARIAGVEAQAAGASPRAVDGRPLPLRTAAEALEAYRAARRTFAR